MKTLQKLQHMRPARPEEKERLRGVEEHRVQRRERWIWVRRLRRLTPLAVVALAVAAIVSIMGWVREVTDGVVVAHVVSMRSPARARVAEVFVRPGQRSAPGDPLIRLEAVTGTAERERIKARVDVVKQRLAWFDAGGELDELGQPLRTDLVLEARRQTELAAADRQVVQARVGSLELERAELELALREEATRLKGAVAALEERRTEADALWQEARALVQLDAFDSDAIEELHVGGAAADRDVLSRRTAQNASAHAADSLAASTRALETELAAAREGIDLQAERGERALAVIDGRLQAARLESDALSTRERLWSSMSDHHESLDAAGSALDVTQLRMLRRGVLEAELTEAEASLAEHDERHGERVLRAESTAIVDSVMVEPGAVVEADAELMTLYDPESYRVVLYVTPELAAELGADRECRVFAEGAGIEVAGYIVSLGTSWVTCPPELPRRTTRAVDLRVPVFVECSREGVEHLAPNMRIKAVFAGRGYESARRRLASWLRG